LSFAIRQACHDAADAEAFLIKNNMQNRKTLVALLATAALALIAVILAPAWRNYRADAEKEWAKCAQRGGTWIQSGRTGYVCIRRDALVATK
jgi:hypothetical protein